jgi:hypothetical protein
MHPSLLHQLIPLSGVSNLNVATVQSARRDCPISPTLLSNDRRRIHCVIGEEAALPSDYANAVFSSNFIANIRTAIQSERTSIVNEGVMLLKNPALSGYPEYRENTQVSNTHLNTIVESVRSISHKDRTRREALAKFCKENNITDEMLESTPVDADETIEQLQEQLDEIDEHLTQLLGLQPLPDLSSCLLSDRA